MINDENCIFEEETILPIEVLRIEEADKIAQHEINLFLARSSIQQVAETLDREVKISYSVEPNNEGGGMISFEIQLNPIF